VRLTSGLIYRTSVRFGKGQLMLRSLVTLPVTFLLLAFASNTATAARVCIGGHFHYGGSELHHDRVHAQASAVRAWRAIQAKSHGVRGRHDYVPGQQADSLPTCPWQRGLALFRPWWSVPYDLKNPARFLTFDHFIGAGEQRVGGPSALPHSEGIAYKPARGEIAMYLRVGRMGPIK
jgi:hypothetical protein